MEGYPTLINRMWHGLPDDLTHVDAAYERPDRKIVFFVGVYYFIIFTLGETCYNTSHIPKGVLPITPSVSLFL